MSMQIHNDGISSTAAAPSAPAESLAPQGASSRIGSTSGGAGDQVEISSFSGNVAESAAALASQQASRVSQLAALYARGEYHVDSRQLSGALVSSALSGSSLGE